MPTIYNYFSVVLFHIDFFSEYRVPSERSEHRGQYPQSAQYPRLSHGKNNLSLVRRKPFLSSSDTSGREQSQKKARSLNFGHKKKKGWTTPEAKTRVFSFYTQHFMRQSLVMQVFFLLNQSFV